MGVLYLKCYNNISSNTRDNVEIQKNENIRFYFFPFVRNKKRFDAIKNEIRNVYVANDKSNGNFIRVIKKTI